MISQAEFVFNIYRAQTSTWSWKTVLGEVGG